MAFWDASAIVPLCCSQAATAQGRKLRRESKRMVVWWGTPLEARSAFARLVREGRLTPEGRVTAIKLLGQLRVAWDEILPSEKVRSLAGDLPDAHNVRAADAAQLAAALVWCRERPKQRPLVCFDERLRTAATALGFSVRP
ncbi:MAG: PIN domain-containing protein [Blastocatellia bacterium]|nr:MAG: PIN domain-containing protein [Blastocatellia bacterium]